MQLIATGKWSKQFKRWQMLVAIRRPGNDTPKAAGSSKRPDRPRSR